MSSFIPCATKLEGDGRKPDINSGRDLWALTSADTRYDSQVTSTVSTERGWKDQWGYSERNCAIMPETCGVAMLVPDKTFVESRPLFPVLRTSLPGANMSTHLP